MRKLAIFCSGYALAVFAAVFVLPRAALLPVSGAVALLASILFLLRKLLPKPYRLRALLCGIGLAAGLVWTWSYDLLYLEPVRQLDNKTVVLNGTVAEYPAAAQYGATVLIYAETERDSVLTLLYGDESCMQLQPGDRISTVARCTLATHTQDGESITYYTAKGIFLTARAYGELTVERPERMPLSVWPAVLTDRLKQSIDRTFPEDAAALVKAVVTGNRDALSDRFTTSLQRTGLAHTVAVSGMHLAYLAGFLSLFLGKGSRRCALVSIPVIVVFALMAGSTPSVVRAAVMVILLQLAPLLGREGDSITSMAFALFLLLVENPFAAAGVGLQLSFGAVAGILAFGNLSERLMLACRVKKPGKNPLYLLWNVLTRFVISTFVTTLGAMVFTTPLTALYFGQVSLIAPLSNLLTLWAVSAVFVGGLAVGMLGIWLPAAAGAAAVPVSWVADYLQFMANTVGETSFASLPITNVYYLAWLLFLYALLVAALLLPGRKPLWQAGLAAAVVLIAAVVFTNLEFRVGVLRTQILDVGQGQSVLIRAGASLILVDCGGDGYDNAGDVAADRVQSLGCSSVDLLVVSHYHDDHANGVEQLLNRVDVKLICLPDVEPGSEVREGILTKAREKQIPVCYVQNVLQLPLEDGVTVKVYPPVAEESESEDSNEQGLTVLCSAGDYDVLLTGDMGVGGEEKLVESGLPDVELMVAGHHGSKYSNSKLLLETVCPDVAVCSVGRDNNYGHPAEDTIARFAAVGAQLYRTDLNGTVIITAQPGTG